MGKSKKKLTVKMLTKMGVNKVFIPGLMLAAFLGWKTGAIEKVKNYYQIKSLFPTSGIVTEVQDGDTFSLKNGVKVRLLGVDAPSDDVSRAENYLLENIMNKKVYLEYDRYQDDKFGRVLAWVWIDCESSPKFLPADYMHKSGNESMPGLTENPKGCKDGKLINEELIKNNYAETVKYVDRGPLKYEARLEKLE